MTDQSHFLERIFEDDYTQDMHTQIISAFKKVNFYKGQYLLQQGQTENDYWFIEKGFIRSYVTDIKGNDVTMHFYSSQDIVIDWTSFFLRTPTQENIQALTDCTCWQLNYDRFQQLFHSIERFREQGRSNLVKGYAAVKKQRVSMITQSATDRYLELIEDKPEILQTVPLRHIATYLGVTDTSLSRIRRKITGE